MDIPSMKSRLEEDLQRVGLSEKKEELERLDAASQEADFWNNNELARTTMKRLEFLKITIEKWESLQSQVEMLQEIEPMLKEDKDLAKDAASQYEKLEKTLENAEIELLLGGKYDQSAAYLTISPGAGGTESKDFAEMLLRMYLRFAEGSEYTATVLEKKPGEEAGIDSATFKIEGPYAYGYMKGESGVHRLIRLSPFNANNLRQTSFVAIEVMPEIPEADTDMQLEDKDLRIDTFRASGAGGQAVNKTDSAVRITHLPTGLVASCQDERSQLQNKQQAMSILKARIATLMIAQHAESVNNLKPEHRKIEFGSQIRTYTIQPYTLVKDHRTNYEDQNVQGVMDGNLKGFLESTLRHGGEKKK